MCICMEKTQREKENKRRGRALREGGCRRGQKSIYLRRGFHVHAYVHVNKYTSKTSLLIFIKLLIETGPTRAKIFFFFLFFL